MCFNSSHANFSSRALCASHITCFCCETPNLGGNCDAFIKYPSILCPIMPPFSTSLSNLHLCSSLAQHSLHTSSSCDLFPLHSGSNPHLMPLSIFFSLLSYAFFLNSSLLLYLLSLSILFSFVFVLSLTSSQHILDPPQWIRILSLSVCISLLHLPFTPPQKKKCF